MSLDYRLLLKMNRGEATVVEAMDAADRDALRVETPVTRFLESLPDRQRPRHIFLTGNAGDGKTFAIESARARNPEAFEGFEVLLDASDVFEPGVDPVRALADQMTEALRTDKRLLVAINRGQFERLLHRVSTDERREDEDLRNLLVAANPQLTLREEPWEDSAADSVLVLDLGLVDTLDPSIVEPVLERLAEAAPAQAMSDASRCAFEAARAALRDPGVRGEVERALGALRGRGEHVTMRQLWTLGAYLATGWREVDWPGPVSVEDAVAARLYSDHSGSPVTSALLRAVDPALAPLPNVAGLALAGSLGEALGEVQVLAPLIQRGERVRGPSALRAAAVHKIGGDAEISTQKAVYAKAVEQLRAEAPGWRANNGLLRSLIAGIYRELSLPTSGGQFLRWQQLCYEAKRLPASTKLADEALDVACFRIALPRPPALAEEAFEGAWSPPYLTVAAHSGGEVGPLLGLSPPLFNRVYENRGLALSSAAREVLRRWLTQNDLAARPEDGTFRLTSEESPDVTTLEADAISHRLSFN